MSSSSSGLEDDLTDMHKFRCLCGLCHVRNGAIIVGLFEFLVIAHSLIFICSNLALGDQRYKNNNPNFEKVIEYKYLLPLLIEQSMWLLAIFIMLLAIKAVIPTLVLPHFVMQIVSVVFDIIFFILFALNFHKIDWNWELGLSLTIFMVVTFLEVYFSKVSYSCYKYLAKSKALKKRRRKFQRFVAPNIHVTASSDLSSDKQEPLWATAVENQGFEDTDLDSTMSSSANGLLAFRNVSVQPVLDPLTQNLPNIPPPTAAKVITVQTKRSMTPLPPITPAKGSKVSPLSQEINDVLEPHETYSRVVGQTSVDSDAAPPAFQTQLSVEVHANPESTPVPADEVQEAQLVVQNEVEGPTEPYNGVDTNPVFQTATGLALNLVRPSTNVNDVDAKPSVNDTVNNNETSANNHMTASPVKNEDSPGIENASDLNEETLTVLDKELTPSHNMAVSKSSQNEADIVTINGRIIEPDANISSKRNSFQNNGPTPVEITKFNGELNGHHNDVITSSNHEQGTKHLQTAKSVANGYVKSQPTAYTNSSFDPD